MSSTTVHTLEVAGLSSLYSFSVDCGVAPDARLPGVILERGEKRPLFSIVSEANHFYDAYAVVEWDDKTISGMKTSELTSNEKIQRGVRVSYEFEDSGKSEGTVLATTNSIHAHMAKVRNYTGTNNSLISIGDSEDSEVDTAETATDTETETDSESESGQHGPLLALGEAGANDGQEQPAPVLLCDCRGALVKIMDKLEELDKKMDAIQELVKDKLIEPGACPSPLSTPTSPHTLQRPKWSTPCPFQLLPPPSHSYFQSPSHSYSFHAPPHSNSFHPRPTTITPLPSLIRPSPLPSPIPPSPLPSPILPSSLPSPIPPSPLPSPIPPSPCPLQLLPPPCPLQFLPPP
ncbi:histone-lysine N-methyltransferase SETD1B-like [Lingula anatina]|uniref:Histone-lysine N-methyltransferase SETD1B-like n=1 Tax=Lingula anatina TaxID=7574 RepID=A0A1S3I1K8_LINAN|nr:histone-lysine N-methyltransferase SETD1B-like [Lingula anatina]|eukprot:XP_013392152.1 histone-lysine N-methyltransferase SETD1B-like [Lingula anatina]